MHSCSVNRWTFNTNDP